jgi:hypothetical protein
MTHDKEIQVAAIVIEDLLRLIPGEKRAAALAIASEAEAAACKEREECDDVFEIVDLTFDPTAPEQRYWDDVMKFKARAAYTFIRNIRNDHSPKEASHLLFQQQRGVCGSGLLKEYLKGL